MEIVTSHFVYVFISYLLSLFKIFKISCENYKWINNLLLLWYNIFVENIINTSTTLNFDRTVYSCIISPKQFVSMLPCIVKPWFFFKLWHSLISHIDSVIAGLLYVYGIIWNFCIDTKELRKLTPPPHMFGTSRK